MTNIALVAYVVLRRGLVAVLVATTALCVLDRTYPAAKVPRIIAVLSESESNIEAIYGPLEARINQTLAEKNDGIKFTFYKFLPEDDNSRKLAVTAALDSKPAILVPTDILSFRDVAQSGTRIPVIYEMNVNPERNTPQAQIAKRRLNMAGVVYLANIHELRFQLLRSVAPNVRNIGVIADRHYFDLLEGHADASEAARRQSLGYRAYNINNDAQFARLWADPSIALVDAWYVTPGEIMRQRMAEISEKINSLGKPSIYWRAEDVRNGGLMAVEEVSPDFDESVQRLILMVLAGVEPNDIPTIKPLGANASLNLSTLKKINHVIKSTQLSRFSSFYK